MALLTKELGAELNKAFRDALYDTFMEFSKFKQTGNNAKDIFKEAVSAAAKVGGDKFDKAAADAIEAFIKSGTVTTVVETVVETAVASVVNTTGTALVQAGTGVGVGKGTGEGIGIGKPGVGIT